MNTFSKLLLLLFFFGVCFVAIGSEDEFEQTIKKQERFLDERPDLKKALEYLNEKDQEFEKHRSVAQEYRKNGQHLEAIREYQECMDVLTQMSETTPLDEKIGAAVRANIFWDIGKAYQELAKESFQAARSVENVPSHLRDRFKSQNERLLSHDQRTRDKAVDSILQDRGGIVNKQFFWIEDGDEKQDNHRFYEYFALQKHAELNKRTNGKLKDLFEAFGKIGYIDTFIDDHNYPIRHQVYKEFIIEAFENAIKGDVTEAMFANFILVITPRLVILEAIVPEIGVGGRLEEFWNGHSSKDLKKYIQKQQQQGFPGEPDFHYYVRYLDKYDAEPVPKVFFDNMFQTNPGKALLAIENLGFWPGESEKVEDGRLLRKTRKMSKEIVWAEHVVSEYLWKKEHGFLKDTTAEPEVLKQLDYLSKRPLTYQLSQYHCFQQL